MKNIVIALTTAIILAVSPLVAQAHNGDRLILVSGATGTQGGAVTRALLDKGFPVRAMTRNPGSARAMVLAELGVEVVQADFNDIESLDRALDGVYGAYSVQQWRGVGTDVEIRQGKDFANAAKRAGVSHFVYSSNGGSVEITGVPHFDSKYYIEEHIRSIDIPYTIVGPRGFMTNVRGALANAIETGEIEGNASPDSINQFIAPRDIGRFVALALDDPDNWIGQRIAIAGEEITNDELAVLISRLTGKNITYRQRSEESVANSTGPQEIRGTHYRVDVDALRAEYPWMLTLEDYLEEVLAEQE